MKFFYIREEAIPVDMEFRDSAPIPKEDMKVLREEAWYEKLMALLIRVYREQVLVTEGMSDKWPENREDVPMPLLHDEGKSLGHVGP
ncbi:hypothetical protein Hanom_Chr11g00983531 [Helianthus anomalus]